MLQARKRQQQSRTDSYKTIQFSDVTAIPISLCIGTFVCQKVENLTACRFVAHLATSCWDVEHIFCSRIIFQQRNDHFFFEI